MTQIDWQVNRHFQNGWSLSRGSTKVRRHKATSFLIVNNKVISVKKNDKILYACRGESKLINSRLKAVGCNDDTPMANQVALQTIYNVAKNHGPFERGYVVKRPGCKSKFFGTLIGAQRWAWKRDCEPTPLFD